MSKLCKYYDPERKMCKGYIRIDQPGGWIERYPSECPFNGRPPEEDRENKWCLGYEVGEEEK